MLVLIAIFMIAGIVSSSELKHMINIDLLVIASFAIAVGKAVQLFPYSVCHSFTGYSESDLPDRIISGITFSPFTAPADHCCSLFRLVIERVLDSFRDCED